MLYKVFLNGRITDVIKAENMFDAIKKADAMGYSSTKTDIAEAESAEEVHYSDEVELATIALLNRLELCGCVKLERDLAEYLDKCMNLEESAEYLEELVIQFQRSFQKRALILFLDSWKDEF